MRYWSFFAAKIAVASVTLYGLLILLDLSLPHDAIAVPSKATPRYRRQPCPPPRYSM